MRKIAYLVFILGILVQSVSAQTETVHKKQYNLEKGLAIQGYDPVSYFSGKPIEGNKAIAYIYSGVQYRFSNAKNLEAFKANPEKYEPQYGGWCAYAMGTSGDKVEVDPETFKIVNGKLYLFYNKYFNNTLKSWNKDEARLKSKADMNWQKYK